MTIPCQSPTSVDNATLQSHFEDSYHEGEAERTTHAAEQASPINDDAARITLQIDQGRIEEAWFKSSGCVICQASASVLCEAVEGKTIEEATNLTADDFLAIVGEPLPVDRQKCALLPWRVFQRALQTPFDHDEDDPIHFGGPSLSEES